MHIHAELRHELHQGENVEGVWLGRVVHDEHAHEHEHRSDERVDEEFDRGVQPVLTSPDSDQEVHREEHDFPEDVEQEEVERREDADDSRLENQEEDEEALRPLVDRPRVGVAKEAKERGQEDQRQAESVDTHEVVDAERRNPRRELDEADVPRGGDVLRVLKLEALVPGGHRGRAGRTHAFLEALVFLGGQDLAALREKLLLPPSDSGHSGELVAERHLIEDRVLRRRELLDRAAGERRCAVVLGFVIGVEPDRPNQRDEPTEKRHALNEPAPRRWNQKEDRRGEERKEGDPGNTVHFVSLSATFDFGRPPSLGESAFPEAVLVSQ